MTLGRLAAVAGIAAYNWWVVVVLLGWLPSPNELFSDLEVPGLAHAALFSGLDVAAGVLLLLALLLRGPFGPGGFRREWPWLLAFSAAGSVGGMFPYVCAEGADAACRSAEWSFQLPPRQYVHIVAGIVEFVTATVAIGLAWRRTSGRRDWVGRILPVIGVAVAVAYPLMGATYLSDRLGSLVEAVFFSAFSVMVAVEVFEPEGRPTAQRWAVGTHHKAPRPGAGQATGRPR